MVELMQKDHMDAQQEQQEMSESPRESRSIDDPDNGNERGVPVVGGIVKGIGQNDER